MARRGAIASPACVKIIWSASAMENCSRYRNLIEEILKRVFDYLGDAVIFTVPTVADIVRGSVCRDYVRAQVLPAGRKVTVEAIVLGQLFIGKRARRVPCEDDSFGIHIWT